jgi:hypothetical protein
MLRTAGVGGDERQVDLGLRHAGEFDLRLLRCFFQALQRLAVLAQIDALILAELVDQPVDDPLVIVIAAEVRIAVGGFHLDHAIADFEHRHVERPAAQVEHQNRLVLLLIETIRQRSRSRLIDDAQHLKPGDLAGVLGRLTLTVVEVCRNGNHRFGHRLAKVRFGVGFEFLQHHRRNLLRRIFFAGHRRENAHIVARTLHHLEGHHLALDAGLIEIAPDEALDRIKRIVRVDRRLALRRLPDQALTVLRERDNRRRGAVAFRVRNNDRIAAFHHRDDRVGCSQVNADNLWHSRLTFFPATL